MALKGNCSAACACEGGALHASSPTIAAERAMRRIGRVENGRLLSKNRFTVVSSLSLRSQARPAAVSHRSRCALTSSCRLPAIAIYWYAAAPELFDPQRSELAGKRLPALVVKTR